MSSTDNLTYIRNEINRIYLKNDDSIVPDSIETF